MNDLDAHLHAKHRHHEGIVIGTIIGSCVVTTFAAIVMAIANPSVILHPNRLTSELSTKNVASTSGTPGTASQQAQSAFMGSHTPRGAAASAAESFSN